MTDGPKDDGDDGDDVGLLDFVPDNAKETLAEQLTNRSTRIAPDRDDRVESDGGRESLFADLDSLADLWALRARRTKSKQDRDIVTVLEALVQECRDRHSTDDEIEAEVALHLSFRQLRAEEDADRKRAMRAYLYRWRREYPDWLGDAAKVAATALLRPTADEEAPYTVPQRQRGYWAGKATRIELLRAIGSALRREYTTAVEGRFDEEDIAYQLACEFIRQVDTSMSPELAALIPDGICTPRVDRRRWSSGLCRDYQRALRTTAEPGGPSERTLVSVGLRGLGSDAEAVKNATHNFYSDG